MDKSKIYLVQTDTTVGFLSGDDKRLSILKQRPQTQKILQVVNSFATLTNHTRIPNRFKNRVRRSKDTTYIYPKGFAYRVVRGEKRHFQFIDKFNILYSTSANKTGEKFDDKFAYDGADVIVFWEIPFYEINGSRIIKLTNNYLKKVR